MPDERSNAPTPLTPLEWQVLLRRAAATRTDTDAIDAWLQDDGPSRISEEADARLRTLLGRSADPGHDQT